MLRNKENVFGNLHDESVSHFSRFCISFIDHLFYIAHIIGSYISAKRLLPNDMLRNKANLTIPLIWLWYIWAAAFL